MCIYVIRCMNYVYICVGVLYPGYHGSSVTVQTILDTTQFPPAVNDWGTKYSVPDMVPSLLDEGESPPTKKN
jgi:hypothetical protein